MTIMYKCCWVEKLINTYPQVHIIMQRSSDNSDIHFLPFLIQIQFFLLALLVCPFSQRKIAFLIGYSPITATATPAQRR